MTLRSLLHPYYSRLRPIYIPLATKSVFTRMAEKLLRIGLARGNEKGPLIVLACMPKSGSTFIAQLLHRATGFPERPIMTTGENPEINAIAVRALAGLGTVSQIHLVCTAKFVELCNSYDIRTIILERNLLDVVVSYAEYMCSEDMRRHYQRFGFINTAQNFVTDATFCDLPISAKYDFILDLALPWYLRFHVAWKRYEPMIKRKLLWLDYDEFFSDISGKTASILDYCDIRLDAHIPTPIQEETKFNVGRPARGKELLSRHQIGRIEKLISYYPQHADELIKW